MTENGERFAFFDAPNTSSQIGAQEASVGSCESKSPHCGQAHIDGGGSEVVLLQKESVSEDHGPLKAKRGSEQYQPMNSSIA
jgi:hypothetical protein